MFFQFSKSDSEFESVFLKLVVPHVLDETVPNSDFAVELFAFDV